MSNTGTLVPRIYANFRGVDFRGEEINLVRSPDSLNVWKDYKETESIRTRPGMELIIPTGKLHNFIVYGDHIILHYGTTLQRVQSYFPYKESHTLFEGMADNDSTFFVHEDKIYILDGKNFLRCDGMTVVSVFDIDPTDGGAYVPTTFTEMTPSGSGKPFQDVNMLQRRRIVSYRADGNAKDFYLPTKKIDIDFEPIVRSLDGQDLSDYTVDYDLGKITFANVPSAPIDTDGTDGADNIEIEYAKTIPEYTKAILNCMIVEEFDNRFFFSGNKDYPNILWHCNINDPLYISDTDTYEDGKDTAQIKGMVAGNNNLWVFREPSYSNTAVFYHTPTIDEEHGKVYPSTHSSIATGCVGRAINFNDDIVFFSDRGMEGITGDITTEQVLDHRSTLVDRKMIAEPDYKNMLLAEWEGYLLVFIGNKVYLADSRAVFTNEDHIEYEWFYWELEKEINFARVYNGALYLGTDDGIYTMTDNNCAIESYWVTPKDKFKYPNMQKTTNKRGCVAEAKGDITVYAKVESTGFELIGEYKDVKDYFVSRIKRKKFKDIQLKFYSQTRFSLETVTLEAWVGGYIKR